MSYEAPPPPDLREVGKGPDGAPIHSDRRLFMRLQAFGGVTDFAALSAAVANAGFDAVLYEDLHDAQGCALLAMAEDPSFFLETVNPWLRASPFAALAQKHEFTMFGRSYSIGYENDLDAVLVKRPRNRALSVKFPWVVWYPVRRSGAFAKLPQKEQNAILGEHGTIGASFGGADLAHDIRLACFGMDRNDNDFVVGLVGKDFFPLSAIVQTMRKTRQTSEFLTNLGPFFCGRVLTRCDTRPKAAPPTA